MKEYSIYVATDKDGIIRESVAQSSIASLKLLMLLIGTRAELELTIRPITVYSTDGIIGRNFMDVDLFHRRLQQCVLFNRKDRIFGKWQYNSPTVIDGKEDVVFNDCPDLHTALQQLVTLEGEE